MQNQISSVVYVIHTVVITPSTLLEVQHIDLCFQKLKVGVLITIFEEDGKRSLTGIQHAHTALLTAKDINNRTDILPSYEVSVSFRFVPFRYCTRLIEFQVCQ